MTSRLPPPALLWTCRRTVSASAAVAGLGVTVTLPSAAKSISTVTAAMVVPLSASWLLTQQREEQAHQRTKKKEKVPSERTASYTAKGQWYAVRAL